MDCHTMGDLHGDGNTYASMLDDGAIDPDCTDCHTDLASNTAHALHGDNISCSACHIQSVVTCNNCHFESEVEVHKKIAYGKFHNWKFLLNRNGKVEIGNYQSVTHNGRSVVAFGPFYAHTIAKDATTCDDCHKSAAVADWFENDDHVMDIVVWNDQGTDPNGKNLTYQTGVIPVPPNFLEGGPSPVFLFLYPRTPYFRLASRLMLTTTSPPTIMVWAQLATPTSNSRRSKVALASKLAIWVIPPIISCI